MLCEPTTFFVSARAATALSGSARVRRKSAAELAVGAVEERRPWLTGSSERIGAGVAVTVARRDAVAPDCINREERFAECEAAPRSTTKSLRVWARGWLRRERGSGLLPPADHAGR
jgi:hypothetical protein